jgi:hypothetical protein
MKSYLQGWAHAFRVLWGAPFIFRMFCLLPNGWLYAAFLTVVFVVSSFIGALLGLVRVKEVL